MDIKSFLSRLSEIAIPEELSEYAIDSRTCAPTICKSLKSPRFYETKSSSVFPSYFKNGGPGKGAKRGKVELNLATE